MVRLLVFQYLSCLESRALPNQHEALEMPLWAAARIVDLMLLHIPSASVRVLYGSVQGGGDSHHPITIFIDIPK